jgi:NADH-ubiquinone oxidoreductase chain 2
VLLSSICLLIWNNGLTERKDKSILFSRTVFIIFINLILISYYNTYLTFLEKGIALFNGLLYNKSQTLVFTVFIYILSAVILLITSFYPRKVWFKNYSSLYYIIFAKIIYPKNKILNRMSEQYKLLEYPLIILFIISGALFLISSNDLISIFLSIELQSYGLYLLSTIYRNSELSTNAGLTYFLLGGLSSCIILLGQSLLYINSGNTNLDGFYIINSVSGSTNIFFNENLNNSIPSFYQYYIQLSLVIISVGFLFKIASAPFHFWSPDVYDAIPTVVTTFVAIMAKISILIFLLDLVFYTSKNLLDVSWKNNLLISSLLSLIIGSILGLTQFRIKRLYAYSTISHVGFILLALSIQSIESIQAFFFYIVQYSISNLNAFILLILMGYSFFNFVTKNKTEKGMDKKEFNSEYNSKIELKDINNSPIQLISQIKGFASLNPMLSISLGITLFSFIGVPPLIGFFGKQMILSAALDKGYIFMSLIAILTSVISAVYYLAVIKNIFFEKNNQKLNSKLDNIGIIIKLEKKIINVVLNNNNIVLSSSLTSVVSIITLIILLFIFIAKEWLNIANILAIILFFY